MITNFRARQAGCPPPRRVWGYPGAHGGAPAEATALEEMEADFTVLSAEGRVPSLPSREPLRENSPVVGLHGCEREPGFLDPSQVPTVLHTPQVT